jgi:hypothetical protein
MQKAQNQHIDILCHKSIEFKTGHIISIGDTGFVLGQNLYEVLE